MQVTHYSVSQEPALAESGDIPLEMKTERLTEEMKNYNSCSTPKPTSSSPNRPVDEQHEIEWNVKAEPVVDEDDDSVVPDKYQPPSVPRQEWIDVKVKTECLYGENDSRRKTQPNTSGNRASLEAEGIEVGGQSEPLPEGNDDNLNSRAGTEPLSVGRFHSTAVEDQEETCNIVAKSSIGESDCESVSPAEFQPRLSQKRPLSEDRDFSQAKRVCVDKSVTYQCPDVISLDSDEDEGMSNGSPSSHSSDGAGHPKVKMEPIPHTQRRYGFRNRKPVDYKTIENPIQEDEPPEKSKKSLKDVLDVFAVGLANPKRLTKLAEQPKAVEEYTICKVAFLNKSSFKRCQTRIDAFFLQCGSQFENMSIQMPYDPAHHEFLRSILKTTTFLSRIHFAYQNADDALCFLKCLGSLVPTLAGLKLVGASGSEYLRKNHIELIATLNPLKSLELGDALWQDVTQEKIEAMLNQHKSTLETLIIHGGYRGHDNEENVINITLPKMSKLQNLLICPEYSFHSGLQTSQSVKAREISLDVTVTEEPFKFSFTFSSKIPTLRRLVAGNLIDINDLYFSQVRDLSEFRVGSFWNLAITFPAEHSRKDLLESAATQLQFPDCLKDPTFVVRARKHFPNVTKVWLNLPSVPVLRAFFKAFEDSQLTHLFLKTQFDFANTMESCLLPNLEDVLKKSVETETLLKTLRKYKHFEEYIRYHNVELPVEQDDLMENHSAGIAALKTLKVLHLEHIPRTLSIPFADEERKWFDHNCKFMNRTFGYRNYPLSNKCHQEIRKLNLDEYTWHNVVISSTNAKQFRDDGFKAMSVQNVKASANGHGIDDEELFEKLRTKKRGTSVKIKPSMLNKQFKPKAE